MAAKKSKMRKVSKSSHEAAIKFLSKANKRDGQNFNRVVKAIRKKGKR